MYQKLSILCLCLLFLCNCGPGADRTLKNEDIPADVQAEIKSRNEQLLDALLQDNTAGVKALASDSLLAEWTPDTEANLHNLHRVVHAKTHRVLDAFLVQAGPGTGQTLKGASGEEAYSLDLIPLSRESYVSVLLLPDGAHEVLLRLVYGRYDDEWKLNSLNFAYYAFAGKNAIHFYTKARKAYEQGYLLNALNNVDLSAMLLNTDASAPLIRFEKEKEILIFRDQMLAEMKATYKMPMELENIPTRPRIFRLSTDMFADDFYPSVSYRTSVATGDSLALRTEYEQLRRETKNIFRGIDKDNAYILFKAFNEGSTKNYVFADTLN